MGVPSIFPGEEGSFESVYAEVSLRGSPVWVGKRAE